MRYTYIRTCINNICIYTRTKHVCKSIYLSIYLSICLSIYLLSSPGRHWVPPVLKTHGASPVSATASETVDVVLRLPLVCTACRFRILICIIVLLLVPYLSICLPVSESISIYDNRENERERERESARERQIGYVYIYIYIQQASDHYTTPKKITGFVQRNNK